MIDPKVRPIVLVLWVGLTVTLLATCGAPGSDPYQAGQAFRQQVDDLLRTSGEFVAGFCTASIVPALLAVVTGVLVSKRGH
jgi:hypothetical protein